MNIGEIKRQALQLIFPELELSFDESDNEATNEKIRALRCDPSLRGYLDASVPAINRAISIIEAKGLSRTKSKQITVYGKIINGGVMISQSEEYGDIYLLKEAYQNGKSIAFEYKNGALIIYAKAGSVCDLVYKEKLPRIYSFTPDSFQLDLEREVAEIIPYFLKGEMQISEDHECATSAIKRFYELLDILVCKEKAQNSVESVYFAR